MTVVALAEAGAACGGKAQGLASLMRAGGLDVPDGFVVTDPAVEPGEVDRHLGKLRGRAVAVRSSGLAEDSAVASFAGQFETVLGVRGLDEVMVAIRRCASSTSRARRYRAGVERTGPVIVQELVEAEVAGVLFTRDPRGGTGPVVINASWGLGESVVSGVVSPDEIVVDGDVVRVTVGAKQTRLDLGDRGLVRSAGPEPERGRACLTAGQVAGLVALGRRCEEIFGGPQDVEWAVRDGRIWLLQSRPITTGGAVGGPGVAVGAPAAAGEEMGAVLVTGVPASPGRALGPVCAVRSVGDFAGFREGDVLVGRTTDPAWTPLFRLAAAVVTETGGVLSHAAIVAREFGLPAVVGAGGAMTCLTDGLTVTVDGGAGTVGRG